jgi:glycosyltransferase involved in cell wall biosynthesis
VELAAGLQRQYSLPMELMVVGQVEDSRQQDVDAQVDFPVIFLGLVPREQIPGLDRSAHLYFSADINAACPNAAIEAMACGLPVTGFATGALPELVSENAGKVAPYGSDPWKLQKPDVPALVYAAASILSDLPAFQRGARQRALEAFGLDTMVDHYLEALLGK